ncbi:hypothetical protein HYALB_00001185 [Hymenoscyphus albidus]|uniref:PXA domain-containing protein n=1 Tax=Hymenoscyphus albidus TaxID=595503 RepID=A0A9N9Q288_9HELO|nr:hypothetical protein HYALB_00001185 [Hymenoscyphus albidus]
MNGTGEDPKHGDGLTQPPRELPTPIATKTPDAPPPKADDALTQGLRFLSTAAPETLGAIAVGLAACTYLILGKLGLILIGALGGVVLHTTWEGQSSLVGEVKSIHREQGLDVVKRILDWRDLQPKNLDEEGDSTLQNSFESFRPETGAALNELVEAVIRDYVKWWYNPILPEETTFPAAARRTLTSFLLSVSSHLSRKRPADAFLDFLTNSSSIVIVFLHELSSALATQPASMPAAEAVYAYLSANPDSNLANVLNKNQHMNKFKMVADDVLQNFLEKRTYDCDPSRVFLREILAGVVLDMTLKSTSKPEWINGWIVYLLEDGEPDLSQAIDVAMADRVDLSNPFNEIDGNVGNVGLIKRSDSRKDQHSAKGHKKRVSEAGEAMDEAMLEAKRLSLLIAEEDAKAPQVSQNPLENIPEKLAIAVEKTAQDLTSKTSEEAIPITPKPAVPITPNSNSNTIESNGSPRGGDKMIGSPVSEARKEVASPSTSDGSLPTQSPAPFTSFDQIVPPAPTAFQDPSPRRKTLALTLHNASIIIHDDSIASDKGKIRTKPTIEYLIQVEPASSDYPGWMTVRKYSDFESLHEVLRRIAKLSGVTAFAEQHSSLPNWKDHTKSSLRGELERYIRDACWHQHLAESEGMKRFLEKDQGQNTSSSSTKSGFLGISLPPHPGFDTVGKGFDTVGKGMFDVITSAPKGVAEGGKAIGGGITNVFNTIGNLGQKKTTNDSIIMARHTSQSSTSTLSRMDSNISISSNHKARASEDNLRAVPIVQTQPAKSPQMERRLSHISIAEDEGEREPRVSTSARSSMSGKRSAVPSRDPSRAPSRRGTPLSSPTQTTIEGLKLPPPPSAMSEDYGTESSVFTESTTSASRTSTSTAPQLSPARSSMSTTRRNSVPVTSPQKPRKEAQPVTEEETRMAVELLFAMVSELYTLSSAWKFRRTLLNAAKTFLLRPGNPSLSSIQTLIQDSLIASNTSDAGIASHLKKLRENTLPTEEELKAWPAEMTLEEKERLRIKARKLLVERGVPAALTGVMGQAATGEAMGRVFDCLQIEEVNQGLMFGILLQCVRVITQ